MRTVCDEHGGITHDFDLYIYPFYIKFQFSLLLSLMQGNTSTGQCAFKSDQPLPPPLSEFAWHQVTYQAKYILSCIPRFIPVPNL